MKRIFLTLVVLGSVFLGSTAYAAEFAVQGRGGQVSISASETHKNLYTAGSTILVNGSTTGDLVAAGGNIDLNGPVSGGLFAAGGTVVANTAVGGNARIAGGNITVNGVVSGDLLVAGGMVSISSGGSVGGDLVAAGGSLDVEGPVAGSARMYGKTVYINGKISGPLDVMASEGLAFGPKADVRGAITYHGPKQASVDPAATVGSIQFTETTQTGKTDYRAFLTFGILVQWVALVLVGLLLLRFGRPFFTNVSEYIRQNPWNSVGVGSIGLIVVPVVIFLLFLTVIGYYAALLLGAAYAFLLLVTGLMSALFTGLLVLGLFKRTGPYLDWQIAVIGVTAWEILRLVPFLGWILMFIIFLFVLGASLVMIQQSIHWKRT